ncbi:unnamed protein product [Nesidiocoris tenuis]|nr:unnamed protein product [Nesidiocoris tenuis]
MPVCKCADTFTWNPVSSECEKPSLPDCRIDSDCKSKESCRPDALGVLKCIKVCSDFTCPQNAVCLSSSHKGYCQCIAGFTGNPNDRNGCTPVQRNTCTQDAQCLESEYCSKGRNGVRSCRPACDSMKCGPNAICVANNHVAKCQCPPGPFTGDPATSGCKQVPCVYNKDCPQHQLCDRLSHSCIDVCDDLKCGDNSVCIGEDHRAICQCPAGYKPNPVADIECAKIDQCDPNPCHPTAICETVPNDGHICKCPMNQVGDPISSGCRAEGNCPNGDKDCPEQSVCQNGRCVNPCEKACGAYAICTVKNRQPVCTCPPKFQHSNSHDETSPCVRMALICGSDGDCNGDICINGQCQVACRNSKDCLIGEKCVQNKCQTPCAGHSQCLPSQACVNGVCTAGCRSNRDCSDFEACLSNKCKS